MSNLLINDTPLVLSPHLAKLVGLNSAIILQQLHFCLNSPRGGREIDGHRWYFNTYKDWQQNHFPFWSLDTIKRQFCELEEMGYIISCQPEGRMSRKKYYRLNQGIVCNLNREISDKIDLDSPMRASCPVRDCDEGKLPPSEQGILPSSFSTKTTTETTGSSSVGTSEDPPPPPNRLDSKNGETPIKFTSKPPTPRQKPFDASKLALPFQSDDFSQAWSEFVQHRIEIKKRLTPTAARLRLSSLRDMGELHAISAIRHSVSNGYTGIFEDWNGNGHTNGSSPKIDKAKRYKP